MPTKQIVLIATAAIAILTALLAWRQRAPAPAKSASQATIASSPEPATAPARADPSVAKPPERSKPDIRDDRPFAEIRPELERRALAGDAAAAHRLGFALANCNRYGEIPEDQIENMIAEQAAKGVTLRDNGRDLPAADLLKRYRLSLEQKRRDCKGVSGLDEKDAFKKAFQWIERAAALGDADAEAAYGSLAFTDIEDRKALAEAEMLRDRRQLAIDYLQRSLSQGDALALLYMSGQYGGGYLFPANPEMDYAYFYAYSLTTRANEIVPELLDQGLSERAALLDEAARQRARAEGPRLAACCGLAAPEGP